MVWCNLFVEVGEAHGQSLVSASLGKIIGFRSIVCTKIITMPLYRKVMQFFPPPPPLDLRVFESGFSSPSRGHTRNMVFVASGGLVEFPHVDASAYVYLSIPLLPPCREHQALKQVRGFVRYLASLRVAI